MKGWLVAGVLGLLRGVCGSPDDPNTCSIQLLEHPRRNRDPALQPAALSTYNAGSLYTIVVSTTPGQVDVSAIRTAPNGLEEFGEEAGTITALS